MATKKTTKKKTVKKAVSKASEGKMEKTECKDKDCHVHGNLRVRGRTFKGVVVSKNTKRVAIEFERMNYIRKYERYLKTKTKMHARLPICMEDSVNVGDLIKIQECRPLSKIIHFVVVEKLREAGDLKK